MFHVLIYFNFLTMTLSQYEITSTARLAIDCGLHQIDEQVIRSVVEPGSVQAPVSVGGILGPPTTVQELEMRLSVFWGVSQTSHFSDR